MDILVVVQDGTDEYVMETARGYSEVNYLQVSCFPLLVTLCDCMLDHSADLSADVLLLLLELQYASTAGMTGIQK